MPGDEPEEEEAEAEEDTESRAAAYEQKHVHDVYEQIAPHFSSTRYKPWPIVTSFLSSLPPTTALLLDLGTGNGKSLLPLLHPPSSSSTSLSPPSAHTLPPSPHTLPPPPHTLPPSPHTLPPPPHTLPPHPLILASDRSPALLSHHILASPPSHPHPHDTLLSDILAPPHPPHCADAVLAIAVLHHLSTRARRVAALEEILKCLRRGGRALVEVWAVEQGEWSRLRGREAREGQEGQDRLVGWVLKDQGGGKGARKGRRKKGEGTVGRAAAAGNRKSEAGEAVQSVCAQARQEQGQGNGDGSNGSAEEEAATAVAARGRANELADRTLHRYYHLYREGELEEDIVAAGGTVLESGYERDNWWAVATPRVEG